MSASEPQKMPPYSVAGGQIVRGDRFVGAVAAVERLNELEEQFEAQGEKVTALFSGYTAKCERFSLGTCDRSADDGTLCRICQFFTDLGYESFEVTSGGLRSWRPVKPLDEAVLNPAKRRARCGECGGDFAGGYRGCQCLDGPKPYPATEPEGE